MKAGSGQVEGGAASGVQHDLSESGMRVHALCLARNVTKLLEARGETRITHHRVPYVCTG